MTATDPASTISILPRWHSATYLICVSPSQTGDAPLMTGEADRIAFDTASKPASSNSAEFSQIARMAASVDTLDGFIREMKIRVPDATARAPLSPGMSGDPVHTGSLPAIVGVRQIDMKKRTR